MEMRMGFGGTWKHWLVCYDLDDLVARDRLCLGVNS